MKNSGKTDDVPGPMDSMNTFTEEDIGIELKSLKMAINFVISNGFFLNLILLVVQIMSQFGQESYMSDHSTYNWLLNIERLTPVASAVV
eukprot:CAMPEP_0170485028 /NCGR_PEP_ID=MMETSP0208-20121228/4384_1 /TAXON_ID=197538 /ORGANISM="Strombidium inclinatum, Strain S3" /LENGTH=88 /DNA_ID=CAMNT_0010758559 /DNA_START=132 /DNA_END=398 /DNA_ORIENTATION=-